MVTRNQALAGAGAIGLVIFLSQEPENPCKEFKIGDISSYWAGLTSALKSECQKPPCKGNKDCPKGHRCVAGVCLKNVIDDCKKNSDCPDGWDCALGACIEPEFVAQGIEDVSQFANDKSKEVINGAKKTAKDLGLDFEQDPDNKSTFRPGGFFNPQPSGGIGFDGQKRDTHNVPGVPLFPSSRPKLTGGSTAIHSIGGGPLIPAPNIVPSPSEWAAKRRPPPDTKSESSTKSDDVVDDVVKSVTKAIEDIFG